MNLEMFSPDNETLAMIMICDANISHIGKHLNINKANVMSNAIYEGKAGSKWSYTRIALNLGEVTAAATGDAMSDFQLVVDYEAVFLYNDFVVADAEYWVSAGAEYNNESIIWIGQTSFRADMDTTNATEPKESPTMNITGDESLYPGRVSMYNLDISVPYLYTNFTVDVFGPLNNSELLTMCGTSVDGSASGSGFSCVLQSVWPYNFELSKQQPLHTNYYRSMLSFTANKITNKAFRMPSSTTEDHKLSLKFALSTNESAQAGLNSYIGATVDFGNQVVTGYKVVTVSSGEQPSIGANTTTQDPTINVTRIGPSTLAPNTATMFELSMDIIPNSIHSYEIQALMPSNDSLSRMRVCSMNITYAGRNIPCVNVVKERANVTFRSLYPSANGAADQHDYAYISLFNLVNTGAIPTDVDPLANRINVRVVAVANNHSLNVPGQSAMVTMGVMYADRQWVSINELNFTDSMNISSLPNSSLPSVSIAYAIGDSSFNIGETAVIDVTTTLKRGVTYDPLDFEFITPYQNGSAVMAVCGYQLISVGKNVGCTDANDLERKISLTSKSNSTVYDKAVFSLGVTSNVGDPSGSEDDDDMIKLRFHVKMLAHPAHSNGSSYFLSYGFQFSSDQIWIAQLSAMVLDPAVDLPVLTGSKLPHLAFESSIASVKAGEAVEQKLLLKVAPMTQSKYEVRVTVPDFASMCTLSVAFVGKNVSCANATEMRASMQTAAFTIAGKEKLTKNATFVIGYLHNAAQNVNLERDSRIDDNTLVLSVVMKLDSAATVSTSGPLTVELFHQGTAAPVQATQSITVATGTPSPTPSNSTPTFSFGLAPLFPGLNETVVYAPGQAFKAVLNITTVSNVNAKLRAQLVSPVTTENQMDILNISVVSVGSNLPCLRPWGIQQIISKRNESLSSDYATLDFGIACNFGFSDAEEDNTITIEAIGRVWTSEAATSGGSLNISCLVFIGDEKIFVQVATINVDVNAVPPSYYMNTSDLGASFPDLNPICAAVGSDIDIEMTVQVPEFTSSVFRIDARNTDLNYTAWATVNEVNITKAGVNMAGLANEPYSLQLNSSQSTWQKDVGALKVFTIQNTGITTVSGDSNPPTDRNNFTVVFNVKISDHILAENGTVFQLSLGLQLLDRIIIGLRDITICRTGSEMPSSEVFVNVTADSAHLHAAGEPVLMLANITVPKNASAELQNAVLFVHTPAYIEFVSFINVSYDSGSISIAPLANAGFKFEFNNTIFFTEVVTFYFTVTLRAAVALPGGKQTANATSVYEMTYKMYDRAGNANSAKWFRNAGSVSFMVTSTVSTPTACSGDLGMNSTSTIPDCNIVSFMDPHSGNEASQVRPTGSGWKPHIRGNDYRNLRWVSVLFGQIKQVTRVIMYATGTNKPTCINVYKTKDGRAYSIHDKELSIGSLYVGHIANISLSRALVARGIRIGICGTSEGSDSEVAVKFGLEGCGYDGPDYYQFDPCTRRPFDESRCGRHYLASPDNSTIFYCDYVMTNSEELSGMSKCYKAHSANPRQWQYLGPAVGKVIAYQETENRVFGYSQGCSGSGETDRSYVVSDDGGSTWSATNPQNFLGIKDSPLAGAISYSKDIAWTIDTGFAPGVNGTDCSAHSAGDWRLCYNGIYHTTNQVVSWNNCCLR